MANVIGIVSNSSNKKINLCTFIDSIDFHTCIFSHSVPDFFIIIIIIIIKLHGVELFLRR